MSAENQSQVWPTFKRLWPYVLPYKMAFIAAIIAMMVYGGVDAAMIYLVKPLIDSGLADGNASTFKWAPLVVVGLFMIRGLGNFVSTYCMAWVSQHVIRSMRQAVFEKYLKLPVTYFDSRSSGDLISKITYDTEQVSRASTNALISMVRDGFTVIGLLFIMFYESWQLSAIFFLVGPVVAWVITIVSRRFRKISKNIQAAMGGVTSASEQMLKGHRNVLAFGGQEVESARFDKVNNHTRQQNMKLAAAQAISQPAIQIIGSIALAVVLFAASFPSVLDSLTPGSFVAIIGAMMGLMTPVKHLTRVNAEFQRGIAAASSVFEVLDEAEAVDNGSVELKRVKGEVRFDNVTFRYNEESDPVLKQIDLAIPAGQTLALVGRSGSGKSTLSSLLPRFYDIASGTITIDGQDIRDVTLASLRNQIAMVSQQVILFNDTIANNIAYACDEAVTREQIEAAAEAAHVMDFVKDMPDGLDTLVGEDGVLLSGGQRQRIAIARALLRDAPILILDEATSALDTESERAIQAALETLQQGRTCLVIAHRLSTIENADQIVVMDKGAIVEKGDHNDLMNHGGIYAQLQQLQASD
ncbi:lipid A ABC exporter, fused ATPase and inner membrane subunits MsbA [Ferrimonas balearica DSM 9799]|uniref:Lipid A ABC exporter, fused ATPase and inner membrane subunits MsbA n=1 Tax=Ferrimonas balearica (strain DSM 9799 / CCM 4581 / KCTC 23876 / PAT) TaxID=550540 RepID=E1SNN1_FERBD|nr:lipid A ABC transporter ATP-binding protein/permease MsbA [Ferrimonas balearica]ADN76704.1 lipid A ABC exporter, fused ATPase and inner membrane subunits MsbA [Ferrimonas balearica DSM 9799]MBW3140309.1 lipid A ABC transporter ATP-binding protein/permease MsbA [Ferrimonas balearica]MBY6106582.1 lipid A ABC transporter ATP-binding protein/permease MsbA [Ferrimonas balearica]